VVAQTGSLKVSDTVDLKVDSLNRSLTASHHSATHLLHFALRETLGTHVKQAGSLVNSEKLRFDFTNKGPLSDDQVFKIEHIVNSMIQEAIPVKSDLKSYTQAVKDGALALFGEKYDDDVRVISMKKELKNPGSVNLGSLNLGSVELCGGTHVSNTAQIKYFKIISESGVSSGVRRIEAVTDYPAINYLNQQFEDFKNTKNLLQLPVQANRELVAQQILKLKNEIAELKKEIKNSSANSLSIDDLLKGQVQMNSEVSFLVCATEISDSTLLRETSDRLKDKMQNGVVVLLAAPSAKTALLVSVTKGLSSKAPAGQILKQITQVFGGSGGGRPDMAQGAVQSTEDFVTKTNALLKQHLESVL
jgi:alanyl-tRNA synthetase